MVTAACSHNKQNEDLKQTNLVMAMDSNSRDVNFTKFVDGFIPDVRFSLSLLKWSVCISRWNASAW